MEIVNQHEDWFGRDGLAVAGLDETCGLVEFVASPTANLRTLIEDITKELDRSHFSIAVADRELASIFRLAWVGWRSKTL